MSDHLFPPAPDADWEFRYPAEDVVHQPGPVHAFSRTSRWETMNLAAQECLHYAPSMSLAYAGRSQSDIFTDCTVPLARNDNDLAFPGPINVQGWTQDMWSWNAQGEASGLTLDHQVPSPPEGLMPMEEGNWVGWNVDHQPALNFNQPFVFPDGMVDDLVFQPPVLTAQPPVLVAPAPVPVPNVTARQRTPAQLGANKRLHCPLGCSATFGRPGNRRRHMRKHEAPRYKCMVIECDKTFARADKLRDHMRKGHRLRL
ncbi:hypothetical protein E8E11_004475 [Didymella keratinophila]|nr:hypothetical protein E8E11_004475 [Didymella keratinophila]